MKLHFYYKRIYAIANISIIKWQGKMRASSVDQIILDVLSQKNAHLTSLQVFEAIRQRLPAVNQSTVYRALDRLANYGKVSVSDLGTGSAVYELIADGLHHHLVCQKCGQIMTIGHEEVEKFFAAIQRKNRFQIITNHLILFGICEKCQTGAENGVRMAGQKSAQAADE